MTKIILHNLTKETQLMLVALLLSSCFVIDKSLFNGIVTAKNLWVQAVSILAMSFIVVYTFLTKQFQIKQADILLFILCLWMIGRELFSTMPHANSPKYILNILVYVCIYVFCRTVGNCIKTTKVLIVSYLSIVCLQAIIGLLQLYGFLYSHHALFKITGTFHNPGHFSGFIVSGFPLAVALYFGTRKSRQSAVSSRQSNVSNRCSVFSKQFWFDIQLTKILDCVRLLTNSEFWIRLNWNKVLNYFAQFVIVVLWLVLPATKSRAAWLGGIVGYFYVAWQFGLHRKVMQRITNNLKLNFNNSLRKTLVLFTILVFTATIFGMYKFKQGSADGRLLMWQVSWEIAMVSWENIKKQKMLI